MSEIILKSAFFKQLKGLNDVSIEFSNTLTAIMGVNGAGKTTVIHALACAFKPEKLLAIRYRFPSFFIPNTDSLWKGSEFTLHYDDNGVESSKTYSKKEDRWAPRYETHPTKTVYYIGIDSCLPEIEKTSAQSRIRYKTTKLTNKLDQDTIAYAASILNKEYDALLDNDYYGKHLIGVELNSGLKYSSLSMGTGEQRILKMLKTILSAEKYSLILIDEIDLLLHTTALKKLIIELHKIAQKKNLQIIFTTHSIEMLNLHKYVKVQYIANHLNKSITYDSITSELIYELTGNSSRTYSIYVEDNLSKAIISCLVRKHNMSSKINIVTFGAIDNAFTLASGFIIDKRDFKKVLIVLDGDKYSTTSEKEKQIKKKLTGTETDIDEKRRQALSIITQYKLPPNTAPEKFLFNIIMNSFPKDNQIYESASHIKAVGNTHEWIYNICTQLGLSEEILINDLFNYAWDDDNFQGYLENITNWLKSLEGYPSQNQTKQLAAIGNTTY